MDATLVKKINNFLLTNSVKYQKDHKKIKDIIQNLNQKNILKMV